MNYPQVVRQVYLTRFPMVTEVQSLNRHLKYSLILIKWFWKLPSLDLNVQINNDMLQPGNVFIFFFGDHEENFNRIIRAISRQDCFSRNIYILSSLIRSLQY